MDDLSIAVNLNEATTTALRGANLKLYIYRAVHSSQLGTSMPLVAWPAGNLGPTKNEFGFSSKTGVFVSNSNATLKGTTYIHAQLGQLVFVDEGLRLSLGNDGDPSCISITNNTSNEYSCGLTYGFDNSPGPICEFPLYGKFTDTITPLSKYALIFSTETPDRQVSAARLGASLSQLIVIDMSQSSMRSVSFDINQGWSTLPDKDAGWAVIYPGSTPLSSILIIN